MRFPLAFLAWLFPSIALAQGTLPIALTQQFSFTNCATFTNACGSPLIGGAVYFYQAGTTSTPQNSFQDSALTILNPWPLPLDANARVPMFYLASGAVHVVLKDVNNVTQYDNPSMLVIGPSGGGGGGGSGVDPTTVAGFGDIKFRVTSEFVTGWVKLNGQTIGGTNSGATQRANADTQTLFSYLWQFCTDAHCPVVGGRGATAANDFAANKQITVPDWRGRGPMGLDGMGNSLAGRILAGQVSSGGGDTQDTPAASGGQSSATLTQSQLPSYNLTVTDPGHAHNIHGPATPQSSGGSASTPQVPFAANGVSNYGTTDSATTGISVNSNGGGQAVNTVSPFYLGTWYIKL